MGHLATPVKAFARWDLEVLQPAGGLSRWKRSKDFGRGVSQRGFGFRDLLWTVSSSNLDQNQTFQFCLERGSADEIDQCFLSLLAA